MSPAMSWAERKKVAEQSTLGSFEDLADGNYNFIITAPARVEEKDGWPRYAVRVVVEDGPRKNGSIWHTFYTTANPNGMQMFYNNLAALGITEENFFSRNPTDEQVANVFVGRRFTAEVYPDTYNGQTRKKLRRFAPPVGSAPAAGPGGAPAPQAPLQAAPVQQGLPQAAPAPMAASVNDPWQAPAQTAPVSGSAPAADPWANVGLQAPPLV